MFFRKFFVIFTIFVSLYIEVIAGEITAEDKRILTANYLCENVSNNLCNISQPYEQLNTYHRKLLIEMNSDELNTMEESLPIEVQNALNDLESATSIYNMRDVLLASIKFSKYYDYSISFYENSVDNVDSVMANNPIWINSLKTYDEGVAQYNSIYVDPYRDSVVSWAELGRNFIDAAKQMKASGDAAISISKATFLYPYTESVERVLDYSNLPQNIESGYKVATEMLPMLKDSIPKILDGTYTKDDIIALLDKSSDILASFDSEYGSSKPAKIIQVINQINQYIQILNFSDALITLDVYYKENDFTKYTLQILHKLLDSKMMIASIDTIKVIDGLLPSGTGLVENTIDILNSLTKAFFDYELTLRRVLHKSSLSAEYLKLYLQRVSYTKHLYVSFIYNYFRKNTEKIIEPKNYGFIENVEETNQTQPTLLITLPTGATIDGYHLYASVGDTVSFQAGITAGYLRDCVVDAGVSATYTLWYIADNQRQFVPLSFDATTQQFSFVMPSGDIIMSDVAYDKNIADDPYSSGFCGLPEVWESVADANTTTVDTNQTIDLISGLVAHYEFEGNANDSSGNGNHGTAYGGVTYTAGVIGQAASFDGVDGKINIDNNVLNNKSEFSISFWANSRKSNTAIVSGANSVSDNEFLIYLNGSTNLEFYYHANLNNVVYYSSAVSLLNDNNYQHIYIKFTTNETQIYENGLLKQTLNNGFSSNIQIDTNGLWIGMEQDSVGSNGSEFNQYFLGEIDDLRIYNRALNEAEIKELYKLGQSTTIPLSDFVYDSQTGNGGTHTVQGENKLTIQVNGGSDGYMGHGDGYTLRLNKQLDLTNKTIEFNIKELLREQKNNYKEHISFQMMLSDGASNIGVRLSGRYSGYYPDLYKPGWDYYNQYYGHRLYLKGNSEHQWNLLSTIELNVEQYYNIDFRIINSNGKYTICHKKQEDSDFICTESNIILSTPMPTINLGAGSGDGGYTRENGLGQFEIDYFRILNSNEVIPIIQNIILKTETHKDGSVINTPFTKQWTFNEDISNLTINIVDNSYQNSLIESDFTKTGNTLSVNLTPNTAQAINKLTLQFTNSSSEVVTVSGSQTFWSLTKTNHAPRLADGQSIRLVGVGSSSIDIVTYDADGDSVALSVVDDAGGTVTFSGNRLTASFNDGNVSHTIKIGLSDGKETVIKEFTVIDFSQSSIENYYVDVPISHPYFNAIAFGTLKGVIGGQVDPNDATQRIFRPDDNVSLAEALKIIINAEQKAGWIELQSAQYYRQTFPTWAMPYYTYAVDVGALDSQMANLAYLYPTRETIAQLIVKTLDLEAKVYVIDSNVSFVDEADFTDVGMLSYAKIAKAFGLFMTGDIADPQARISRAELAQVIERIFMIPQATLSVSPQSIEYGDTLTASLSNIQADAINPTTHELYNAVDSVQVTYLANGVKVNNPIDSHIFPSTLNTLHAVLDNGGVKNIITTAINMNYTDADNDGLQDRIDKWATDIRYAFDDNDNGIPDILDDIYNLTTYTVNETVTLDGYEVSISQIIADGGWFAPDLDGDGISDALDPDIDGDGVVNVQDAFPRDKNEWLDTDGDGIGNNADSDDDGDGVPDYNDDLPLNPLESVDTDGDGTGNNADRDDDNDGISDVDEIKWGFDPLDPSDGGNADADGDGVSNKDEIEAGSNPLDPNDTKKPKKFIPIMMDDLMVMVPLEG